MNVEELMSDNPFAVSVDETIGAVMNKLMEADVRHLPVVEDGALVGIVSDRDLRAFTPTAIAEFDHPQEVAQRLAQPIGSVMSSDVLSVTAGTDVTEVVDIMLEQRIGAVPVVEPDSSRLVGIVSYMDVLRAARDSL